MLTCSRGSQEQAGGLETVLMGKKMQTVVTEGSELPKLWGLSKENSNSIPLIPSLCLLAPPCVSGQQHTPCPGLGVGEWSKKEILRQVTENSTQGKTRAVSPSVSAVCVPRIQDWNLRTERRMRMQNPQTWRAAALGHWGA